MLIEFLHPNYSGPQGGPSGKVYVFELDGDGRRVAEVNDQADIERFLSIVGTRGEPLYIEAALTGFDPDLKNYDVLSKEELREMVASRTGKTPGGRATVETLIAHLRELDEGKPAEAEPIKPAPLMGGTSGNLLQSKMVPASSLFQSHAPTADDSMENGAETEDPADIEGVA